MTAPTVFINYNQVSADQFIAAALTWFGDPDPTQGSPWDKGERLANDYCLLLCEHVGEKL